MFNEVTDKKAEMPLPLQNAPAEGLENKDYFYRRAEQELELAQAATHPAVVKAHYVLAGHYLDSLYREDAGEKDMVEA